MKKRKGINSFDRKRWVESWKANWSNGKYAPFVRTEDVPSSGNKHRCRGIKSNRVHHFLSANEYFFFIKLEFQPEVLAIYEQFPMLPLMMTKGIAKELEITHPKYPRTQTDMILTTDFVIQLDSGEWRAYSIKPETAMKNARTIKKQVIEKAYWELHGIVWEIVLDSQLKTTESSNLSLLRHYSELPSGNTIDIKKWMRNFRLSIIENDNERMSKILYYTSINSNIDQKSSSTIFFYCIWHRLIKVNLDTPIHLEKTPNDLGISFHA
ncbi:TnsA endonuclease N-terminal domain-containing protein [Marinobacter sp.]|uniref:TnsA endonuclease N-terminal domain-containing protein n=1 Tax=Marinobacter sp. TaxID=50741 RepID=UPI003BABB884